MAARQTERFNRRLKMSQARVELRKSTAAQPWHWVVIAPNNEVVLTSENYHNKEDAEFQATQEAEGRGIEYVDASQES
jgi:uncharacterized protein YegP (UPF0339 family)